VGRVKEAAGQHVWLYLHLRGGLPALF
jgi:hypothetical protein